MIYSHYTSGFLTALQISDVSPEYIFIADLKHIQQKYYDKPSSPFCDDIDPTGELTRTATALSHAMPITLPFELTVTTPKKVHRITPINVIITAWHRKPIILLITL
jgi:hypothetical protein